MSTERGLRLTGSKEAGAAVVATTESEEGSARRIVLAIAAAKDGASKGAATIGGARSGSRAGTALLVGARGAMAAVRRSGREDGGAVIPIEEAHCARVWCCCRAVEKSGEISAMEAKVSRGAFSLSVPRVRVRGGEAGKK